MVAAIRNIEKAISGNGTKEPSKSEMKNIGIIRKSIHLLKDIKAGATIIEADIVALRPGGGISPMEWEDVIGKKAAKDLNEFDALQWEDLTD